MFLPPLYQTALVHTFIRATWPRYWPPEMTAVIALTAGVFWLTAGLVHCPHDHPQPQPMTHNPQHLTGRQLQIDYYKIDNNEYVKDRNEHVPAKEIMQSCCIKRGYGGNTSPSHPFPLPSTPHPQLPPTLPHSHLHLHPPSAYNMTCRRFLFAV